MSDPQLSIGDSPLRVVQLTAENFMRLSGVDISPDPDEPVVRITGANGAGKSSVINAIWAALGGKDVAPDKAVRLGETEAEIMLDLGRLVVRRKFTAKGSYLTVCPKDANGAVGSKLSSPQAVLDQLLGQFTLDPVEFSRLPAKEQRDVLLALCGLGADLDALEVEQQAAYQARADANRETKRLEGSLTAYGDLPEKTPEPVDVSALTEQRRQFEEQREEHRAARDGYEDAQRDLTMVSEFAERAEEIGKAERVSSNARIAETEQEVARLQAWLEELQQAGVKVDETAADIAGRWAQKLEASEQSMAEAKATYEAMDCPSTDALDEQLTSAAERNTDIAVLREQIFGRDRVAAELTQARSEAKRFDRELKDIEARKTALVRGAKLPVAGLGFEPDGVTFDDGSGALPLGQINDAERLRISMAVAMAGRPAVQVLRVDDGEKLDDASFALMRKEAANHGFQVWITQVDTSGELGIVIEDGAVVAVNPEAPSED